MGNTLKIRDYSTLTEVGTITNVINPVVSETINDSYTFDFETIYDDSTQIISGGKIIEVDNDYFQVMIMTKSSDLNYKVTAEHISYRLNNVYYEALEYEGTAAEMLNQMFGIFDTGFTLGTIAPTSVKYFKASNSDNLRKRIIMIANLFELEIVWNKFTVSLVTKRGINTGLKFELGKNLIGVTETYDLTQEQPEAAYEVDVLDLSELEGYGELTSIGLGDTVNVVANNINLNVTKRVIKREFNPFSRANVQINIGRVMRDFTDYIKEIEEEEKEEEEEEEKTLLSNFKVGDIDCLKLEKLDVKKSVIEYITNTAIQGIDVEEVVELSTNKTGVFAALRGGSRILTALITTETESGTITTTRYIMPNATLNTITVPGNNKSITVTIVVTEKPFSEVAAAPELFENETPPFLEAYGVNFLINNDASGYFESFQIGELDVLSLGDIDETGQILSLIDGGSTPIAGAVYTTFEKLKGINAKLKAKVKGFKITMIHSVKSEGEEGTWSHTVKPFPLSNAREFTVTTNRDDSIILVITDVPFANVTSAAVAAGTMFLAAFGVRITEDEILPEDTYRLEFGTIEFGTTMRFDFEYSDGYGEVDAITTGLIGDDAANGDIKLVAVAMKEDEKYTHILVYAEMGEEVSAGDVKVSIQAVCYTGFHERSQ